ncbi:MAG: penicillin acylase family protein [Bryobacteraceae bacterium]
MIFLAAPALGLLATGGAYWMAYRALPVTSGTIAAPVKARAKVTRDAQGVPSIEASSERDAFFLQGYVTAQDRLFQMEYVRRDASGRLAEIVGRSGLESDIEVRRLRMPQAAEMHTKGLSDTDRAPLDAYAQGVNRFLETHRGKLPVEFRLAGIEPEPWTAKDCVLVYLQFARTLSHNPVEETSKEELLAKGDAAKVQELLPVRAGGEMKSGSNGWAIAGSRTKSGKPILASDPHLLHSDPEYWYRIHLRGGELHTSGVSIPGLPGITVGQNDHIAWGLTNLLFDLEDLYIETGAPLRTEHETIRVRGEKPVELAVPVYKHGPELYTSNGRHYAVRWAATEPGFAYVIPAMNRARNWSEFRQALAHQPAPSMNWVYADTEGNIGMQSAGPLPLRRDWDGDVPQTASDHEWAGYIPFEDMPSVFNPPSGFVVAANQNLFPSGYKYRSHGAYAPHYRAARITEMLAARKDWDADSTLTMQNDVYSAFLHFIAREVSTAAKRRSVSGDAAKAATLLAEWNGQAESGLAAPLIASETFLQIRVALAERAAPGAGSASRSEIVMVAMERLLQTRPAGWFPDWDEFLAKSLSAAVEAGKKKYGPEPAQWTFARFSPVTWKAPVLGDLRLVGRYFQTGPIPQRGTSTSIHYSWGRLGQSMRMVADMSNLEHSLLNTVVGQSGQVLSPHYRDQLQAFHAGKSYPMPFGKASSTELLEFVPE